VYEKIHKSIG